MLRSLTHAGLAALLSLCCAPLFAQDESPAARLYQQARQAWAEKKLDETLALTQSAVEADLRYAPAWQLRGMVFEQQRKHREAIDTYSKVIELLPEDAASYDHRGSEELLAGKFQEAVADFDKAISLEPERGRRHWKRGIACYYAGKYADGAEQFAQYQTFDSNDVENSVWRFLCMAKDDSLDADGKPVGGLEKARTELLPIENDRRVPLMVVYALFRGEVAVDDVLSAVKQGSPEGDELKLREFYAHLYLGLYHDAIGKPEIARRHLQAAVERELPGYMWDIAKVHAEYLAAEKGDK